MHGYLRKKRQWDLKWLQIDGHVLWLGREKHSDMKSVFYRQGDRSPEEHISCKILNVRQRMGQQKSALNLAPCLAHRKCSGNILGWSTDNFSNVKDHHDMAVECYHLCFSVTLWSRAFFQRSKESTRVCQLHWCFSIKSGNVKSWDSGSGVRLPGFKHRLLPAMRLWASLSLSFPAVKWG